MASLLQVLGKPALIKFIDQLSKMTNPEIKVGAFEIDGETWQGLLVRDKPKKKGGGAES